MKTPSRILIFAALYLAGSTAAAVHIHFQDSYDGPWKWDEITMTESTVTTDERSVTICKGTARITGYSGTDPELVIPRKISWSGDHEVTGVVNPLSIHFEYEVDVVALGDSAFSGRPSLTSVTIPDSVTSIGNRAFNNCSGLTSVTINGNVTNEWSYFDWVPFRGCNSIRSVSLGNKMTKIGGYMFYGLESLESVTIPDSVTSIGQNAFYGCSGLTSVTIGNSVTSIGNSAFGFSGLSSVTIPYSVTSIGDYAFSDCSGLTSVTILSSVTSIVVGAFSDCSGLTSVTIPNSVTSIGSSAFRGCSSLTSVTIPDSVTSIGDSAFSGCSGLTSVTIPSSVTSIGLYAFWDCSAIKTINILGNVTNDWMRYTGGPFRGCQNLETITLGNNMTKIGHNMFDELPIKTVVIGSGVTSIGDAAFYLCGGLTSVTIGNGVKSIGASAFYGCSGLVDVYYQSDIATWCAINFKDMYSSPFLYASNLYFGGALVTSLIVSDDVEIVPAYAFHNCDCLKSVHIPDSVTNIGAYAFSSCDNLTAVWVPQSAMTQGLRSVFAGSYQKLRSVTLGADVTTIRDDEFQNFRALEELAVEAGNANYRVPADGCLYNASMTTLVACPRNATQVTIPSSVTKIYDYALDGCGTLWANWYKALSNLASNGGTSGAGQTGGGEAPDPRYTLSAGVADRTIATVTVDCDCAIDSFVLTDGKVYDTVLRVINVSDRPSRLFLPSGYSYERLKGTSPLTIPALSTNLLTITRTADRVFFVAREVMESAQ